MTGDLVIKAYLWMPFIAGVIGATIAVTLFVVRDQVRLLEEARAKFRRECADRDEQQAALIERFAAAAHAVQPATLSAAESTGRHAAPDIDPAAPQRTPREKAVAALAWIRQRPAAIRAYRNAGWAPGELAAVASGAIPAQRRPRHLAVQLPRFIPTPAPRRCVP